VAVVAVVAVEIPMPDLGMLGRLQELQAVTPDRKELSRTKPPTLILLLVPEASLGARKRPVNASIVRVLP
jgi:hypothetical protein